jgi:hypothetical protein
VCACALACALLVSGSAGADSFTPITLQVSSSAIGRLHGPLPVTVAVTADQGVLDTLAPVRARVKLATECGGDFTSTVGTVLLDRRLTPQPDPAEAYHGQARGSGRPAAYGAQSVCVYIEEEGDYRQYASDTAGQLNVTQGCTSAAGRYDTAAAALARARSALRHARGSAIRKRLKKLVAKRSAATSAARRAGRVACGPVLPL